MKMSKEERDQYILTTKKTLKELAEDTGWSLTTVKSVRRRLGLQTQKSTRVLEMEAYAVLHYDGYDVTDEGLAEMFGMKRDNVRDALKALGIYKSVSDIAGEKLFTKYCNDFYFRTPYKGTKSEITLQCRNCGKTHTKRANNIVSGHFTCDGCLDTFSNIRRISP